MRQAIFNAIPTTLKAAVSVGIGLFIAFIGLQDAKLIVANPSTLVSYQTFKGETFHSIGVGAILALLGVLITAVLLAKRVKGGILIGIIATWILGIIAEIAGIYVPDAEAGMYSVIPSSIISLDFSSFSETFGAVFTKTHFSSIQIGDFIVIMFSFLFVDLFDTLEASQDQTRSFIRRSRHLCRRRFWNLHHYHICGERFWSNCRRTHWTDRPDHGCYVLVVRHLLPLILKHTQLRHCSSSDYCGLLYDGRCSKN